MEETVLDELTAFTGLPRAEVEARVSQNIARSARAYLPNLKLGVQLGEQRPTTWLVRENSPELRAALNKFLKEHLNIILDFWIRKNFNRYSLILRMALLQTNSSSMIMDMGR